MRFRKKARWAGGGNFSGYLPAIDKDYFAFSIIGGKGVGHYVNATNSTNADAVLTTSNLRTIPLAGGHVDYQHQ